MARINIIYFDNNHGLAKDGRLMADILEQNGHQVIRSDLVSPPLLLRLKRKISHAITRAPIYDMNIHVESCVPSLFHFARRNVLVPNLEALRPETAEHLHVFDAIFCKTKEAYTVLGANGLPVFMTGFSTPTKQIETCRPDWRSFFHASGVHVLGGVSVKGTDSIYRVWSRHPEWPTLTIVGCHHPSTENIRCINEYIPEQQYRLMQARMGIHLCMSEMEGFGHYIMEPMSMGCVVVTTDGAPMNELVTQERGYAVTHASKTPYMFGQRYTNDENAFEETIDLILNTSEVELEAIGSRAKNWYRENDFNFRNTFGRIVREIAS